eukprot:9511299-Ditylum_brightwellii.AAC.1
MVSATPHASKSKAEKTQQSTARPLSPAAEITFNTLSAARLLPCSRTNPRCGHFRHFPSQQESC